MDSGISNRFEEIYYCALWNEIKNRCIQHSQGSDEISGRCIAVPWFGDIQFAWNDFKKECPKDLWNHFPAIIKKNRLSEIASELRYLLPESNYVKAFLPVLLSSYVSNRKINFSQPLKKEALGISQIEHQKHLWSTPSLSENYPKMTADDVKLKGWDRALSVYSKIIQFFLFIKVTSHICDVGSSFFMFEVMTGYLHLLGADARYYIDELGRIKKTEEQFLCTPNEYNEEIKKYIINIIQSTNSLHANRKSFEFLTFLYNLKCELSPNGNITLTKDDPLEIAHQFDLAREAYLVGDMPGIFDEMCTSKDT